MIPDNYPECKKAFEDWKTLEGGSVDEEWDRENKRIDEVNSLARAEYIRINGDDTGFFPIPHVNEEFFHHLAVHIWDKAGGPKINVNHLKYKLEGYVIL